MLAESHWPIPCDFGKESLPYITALLMLIFTGFVYREALIGVAPTLFAWIIHALKKRSDRKDRSDSG
jgi:hypothetical protein